MPNLDAFHQPYWTTMGPILILTATAFVVMILEFLVRSEDKRWLNLLSALGVAGALVDALYHWASNQAPTDVMGTIIADAFGNVFGVIILIAALLILLFAYDYTGKVKLASEHSYLIVFAVVGAMAMAYSVDMVTLYVGLELLSVASYVLAALRTKSIKSIEGGIKYLLMGSIGSAVLLYGMSFIYGLGGSTNLLTLASKGSQMFATYPQMTVLAFLFVLVGMGVKLSVVPFHMWTPDTYDGAPSPITTFLATLSKTAAFAMLLRVLLFVFYSSANSLFYWAGILAAVTMVIGNLIALPQRNMKRLMAFSSVAQAGYVLVPFALIGARQITEWTGLFDSVAFYLYAYTFMTVGAFAVIHVVSHDRHSTDSESLVGLYRRSPWLAGALTLFLLSLAGMPLTAGFVGKFYIFADTIHMRQAWLGILLFLTSVVSFYYYFGLIRKIFQREPAFDNIPVRTSAVMNVVLGLCVLGTLALGLVPALLLHPLSVTQWFYS